MPVGSPAIMLLSLLPKDATSESLLPIAGGPYCFIKLFEKDLLCLI
jgi:hypothetical protein